MRVIDDSFAALVRAYLASPIFEGYEEATRSLWARYLRLAAEPDRLGAVSLQTIRPALVQAYIDGLAGKPGKQRATRAALKQIEAWAIVLDHLPRPITTGVRIQKSDGGHTPWSDHHVELVERHGREDMRRMVVLGANTGQRGSDLVRMGWSDIETYRGVRGIHVKQKKTGREVWIPITKHLADEMATWERKPGPFLRKLDGALWTREHLHHAWVRHRDSNPELELLSREGLVPHGLRGHACVRLLRIGANTRQISDWVGMSEQQVKGYTRFSDQRDNAIAAVFLLDGTKAEQPFDKRRFGRD
jgi:integrase